MKLSPESVQLIGAARIIGENLDDTRIYSCNLIADADLKLRYANLFNPDGALPTESWLVGLDSYGWETYGEPLGRKTNELRIIMLCLAAAMASTGDLW